MIAARCNGCGRIGCDGNNMICSPRTAELVEHFKTIHENKNNLEQFNSTKEASIKLSQKLNMEEIDNYLKTNFTKIYDGLYKSRKKWLGAGTGDDKSLCIDITGGDTLIYWIENRGFEMTIFEGREIKSVEEFEQLFDFLDVISFISRKKQ